MLSLVLCGGGAKGSYQIGVWKALDTLGIKADMVAGSSIGSLNAVMYAQGSYTEALEVWGRLEKESILTVRKGRENVKERKDAGVIRDLAQNVARYGGSGTGKFENLLNDVVDEQRVRKSDICLGISTTHFPARTPVQMLIDDIPPGKLIAFLAASSAYYPIYRLREIDGEIYGDGAFSDNMPINLTTRSGATEVIAVDLSSTGIIHKMDKDVPLTYIGCESFLGPVMGFSPNSAERNIRLGYLDTMKAFKKLEGWQYGFWPGESEKNLETLMPGIESVSRKCSFNVMQLIDREHYPLSRFERRRDKVHYNGYIEPLDYPQMLAKSAEYAGAILGMENTEAYYFDDYNEKLLRLHDYRINDRGIKTMALKLFEESSILFSKSHWRSKEAMERVMKTQPEAFFAALYMHSLMGM